ncbi:MAG: KEOPS complex subunit Cgi121 [Candidatus Thermoplasmatota archaeon]|nr:KEOPS complex subunit Cgi121 [Candidatus Thermoplasmatota archaeon]
MLRIIGTQGNVQDVDSFLETVLSFAQKYDITIQAFDADMIYGENHLISSVEHAARAIKRKTNTTNSIGMEILLYASGERQLKLAIPKVGIKEGGRNVAFVFVGNIEEAKSKMIDNLIDEMLGSLSLRRNDDVLEGDKDVLRRFGIDENEIKTVTKAKYGNLILEKVAMVDIIK